MRRLALFISLLLLALPGVASAAMIDDSGRLPAHIDFGVGKAGAIPGEWVIAVDTTGAGADVSRAIRAGGASVRRVSRDARRVQFRTGGDAEATLRSLARRPGVLWIEPLYERHALYVPTDPSYPSQWGLPKVGAPAAWEKTRGLRSVVIAVVDTGVKLSHPDVAPHIDTANDYDFVNNDEVADDDQGHGTHVAGIAASLINGQYGVGLAADCTILPVKVLDARGWGDTWDVAEGIELAAGRGADVINLSLGGSYSSVEQAAVAYAQSKNVVVVAAAGNEAQDGNPISYPAGYAGVIGVGATNSSDAWASFSNYNSAVDIAAPGVDIASITMGGPVEAWSGTSMATPFVAAAAALVRTALPDASWGWVADRLTSTATDLGTSGLDDYYGHGRLDVASALAGLPTYHLDDNIPGHVPSVSPLSGAFEVDDDPAAVYRFMLAYKESISATLTGAVGTEYDIRLYGPTATNINESAPLAASATAGSSESLTWKATTAGEYYLAVERASGFGSYELQYRQTPPKPDLRATAVSGPTTMYSGGTVNILDAVTNEGDLSAAGFYVGYYLSADNVITTADTYLGRRYVSTLAAGQSSVSGAFVALPQVEGVLYLGTIPDYLSTVTESDEADNALAATDPITVFVNHVPFSVSRTEAVTEDVAKAFNILAGITDADGNTLTVQLLTLPVHGTLQSVPTGAATYAPNKDYVGSDALTYRVFDGYQYSGPSTLTFAVAPVNDTPVLVGTGDVTVAEDCGPYSVQWASAINAGAANETAQVLSAETTSSNPGLFSAAPRLTTDGKLSFTPAANANGSAEVTVTLTDDATAGGAALSVSRTLRVSVTPVADATSIPLSSASTTLRLYGASYRLSGVLKFGTVPTGGKRVILQQASYSGGPYYDTSFSATTTADGKFVMPAVIPRNKTYYRARFAGEAGEWKSCTSAAVYVIPRAYVTNAVAPSVMYRTRYSAVYGYIKPRHVAGTYPVRVYAYRYYYGAYRYYRYYNARAYAADSTRSKYIVSIRLPYAGKWRLRAYAPADYWHAAAWSGGYDYVTVK